MEGDIRSLPGLTNGIMLSPCRWRGWGWGWVLAGGAPGWPLPHSNHNHLIVPCLYIIYWSRSYWVFLKILDTSELKLLKIIPVWSHVKMCGAPLCHVCLRKCRQVGPRLSTCWVTNGRRLVWARNGKTRNGSGPLHSLTIPCRQMGPCGSLSLVLYFPGSGGGVAPRREQDSGVNWGKQAS